MKAWRVTSGKGKVNGRKERREYREGQRGRGEEMEGKGKKGRGEEKEGREGRRREGIRVTP